jgi:hypothetical protein
MMDKPDDFAAGVRAMRRMVGVMLERGDLHTECGDCASRLDEAVEQLAAPPKYESPAVAVLRRVAAEVEALRPRSPPPPQPRRDLHDTGRADESGLEVSELEHDPRAPE